MRALDPAIQVLPDTDIASAWDRFEVFEALHHTMQICNPMTSDQLDEVIRSLGLRDDMSVFDVACGYGELLYRCAATATISGLGIDLSPWMISAAHADERAGDTNLQWVLGEARDFVPDHQPDVAICTGAEWVWHDFNGTARALSQRLTSGGVAVIGAARLHHDADRAIVRAERGHVDTVGDMGEVLQTHDLQPFHRIDPDDAGWDAYLARTASAAAEWARTHPGPRADQWLEEQADWQAARERDRDVIGWSVWIAHKE